MTDHTHPGPNGETLATRLRRSLSEQWREHRADPVPADWLDTATAILAAPSHPGAEHHHREIADAAECQDRLLAQMRDHNHATAAARRATDEHTTRLHRLREVVREQARVNVRDYPGLLDPAQQALADWGLPLLEPDWVVTMHVAVRIQVPASGEQQASEAARERLDQVLAELPADLHADPRDASVEEIDLR